MAKMGQEQSLHARQQQLQQPDQEKEQERREQRDEHEHECLLDDDDDNKNEGEREGDTQRQKRRVHLVGRPRTPEPMGLGMTHPSDDEEEDPHHHWHHLRRQRESTSPPPPSHAPFIDQLLQRSTTLSAQVELAMEVSSSLQTQHAGPLRTIEVLEEKVVRLEVLVKVQAPAPAELTPAAPPEQFEPEIPVPIPTEPAEPAAAPPPACTTTITGLADSDDFQLEKVRQGPVVLRARGMGCGARAPGECRGGMGVAGCQRTIPLRELSWLRSKA